MKKVIIISLLLALLLPGILRAQEDTVPDLKNAFKWNTMGMFFHNGSLIYERYLNGHWSVVAGAGYKWSGSVPRVLGLGNLVLSTSSNIIHGYSFTPEVRYYFKSYECIPPRSGLYAGFYTRYTRLAGDLALHYWNGTEYIDLDMGTSLRELGMGIQLGYQLVIRRRFLVDFMFAGPRLSTNLMHLEMGSEYLEEIIPVIEKELNERLEGMGQDPVHINPSPETDVRFGFKYFRYGIGIGILF